MNQENMETLKKQIEKNLKQQLKIQQQIETIETIAKQYLTKEAVTRYGNLRIAYPEKAVQIASLIVKLAQTGNIKEKLTDGEFKNILKQFKDGSL